MSCRLTTIAQHGVLSVMPLSCPQLAHLLPRLLPSDWKDAAQAVSWSPGEAGQPTREWMGLLWQKLQVGQRSYQHFSRGIEYVSVIYHTFLAPAAPWAVALTSMIIHKTN